jgi:hypothetical protein
MLLHGSASPGQTVTCSCRVLLIVHRMLCFDMLVQCAACCGQLLVVSLVPT